MHPALALAIAYVAGSFPTAYLAGRALKGVDLRTIGSGNLGATNVYRNLGATAAVLVLLVDALKGALPAAVLPGLLDARFVSDAGGAAGTGRALWWGLLFGAAAIAGHAKPILLLWKGGGKGVSTAAGIFAALSPAAFGISLSVFALTVWRTRLVSLASIFAAIVLPMAVALTSGVATPTMYASLLIASFVVWSHRANIDRLRLGTEPRLGRPAPEESK